MQHNISLKPYNSFGIDVQCRNFVEVKDFDDLKAAMAQKELMPKPWLILGGGSNVLFTKDYEGTIIKISLDGITAEETDDKIHITAGAGVLWNDLVNICVSEKYAGIENLSLIPGTVGSAPIQNIGAYGVELKDVFHSLSAYNIQKDEVHTFYKADCNFGYRESVFKTTLKDQYIILSVTLELSHTPKISTHYGAIQDELTKRNIDKPTIKDISQVVSHIRVSKLPDPSTIGNAGSFFKNPVIDKALFDTIIDQHPNISHYPAPNNGIKLAAGWLIEQCGWKGKVVGNTGTWHLQALVLVNHGGANGNEVFQLSSAIIDSVFQKFGVKLEREVNII